MNEHLLNLQGKTIVYFYTPLCGTCQMASKMVDIIELSLPKYRIEKINLNLNKDYAAKYLIESVPCILLFDDQQLLNKIYRIESVTNLYNQIQKSFDI